MKKVVVVDKDYGSVTARDLAELQEKLAAAGEYVAGNEALYMGIVKQGRIKLYKSALGGQMSLDGFYNVSQGLYTPYRYSLP